MNKLTCAREFLARGGGKPCCIRGSILVDAIDELEQALTAGTWGTMKAIEEKKLGAYVVGGEQAGQPEYFPLEVIRGEEGALWSAWVPSLWERVKVLFGVPIRVGVLSYRQPPIILEVR